MKTQRMHPIKRWLFRRADNYQQNLKLLISGFGLFALGALLIATSEFLLRSSLLQESLALLGLVIAGTGIILAAFGYICLSVLRLFRILSTQKTDD